MAPARPVVPLGPESLSALLQRAGRQRLRRWGTRGAVCTYTPVCSPRGVRETLLRQGSSHHTGNLRAGAHGSWLSHGITAPQWFYKESRGYTDLGCRVHADEEMHSRILPCSTYNLKAAHTG